VAVIQHDRAVLRERLQKRTDAWSGFPELEVTDPPRWDDQHRAAPRNPEGGSRAVRTQGVLDVKPRPAAALRPRGERGRVVDNAQHPVFWQAEFDG
jgi:hypothetical protein